MIIAYGLSLWVWSSASAYHIVDAADITVAEWQAMTLYPWLLIRAAVFALSSFIVVLRAPSADFEIIRHYLAALAAYTLVEVPLMTVVLIMMGIDLQTVINEGQFLFVLVLAAGIPYGIFVLTHIGSQHPTLSPLNIERERQHG